MSAKECLHCGRTTFAMFEMAGGNGLPKFTLCMRCWRDGLTKKRQDDKERGDDSPKATNA